MPATVLWFMLFTQTGHLALPVSFPSQADCLRGISQVTRQGALPKARYRCVSLTVATPSTPGIVHPQTQRNAAYDQAWLQRLITDGPRP